MLQDNNTALMMKKCPHCRRVLPLHDFYTLDGGLPSSWCKECIRADKREKYRKKRPDGILRDNKTGRIIEKKGCMIRLFWSKQMIDDIKRYYPYMINEDLAGMLGVSPRTLTRKARELGLNKDNEWLNKKWSDNRLLANVIAKKKGYPGAFPKGFHNNPDGEFRPGHRCSPEIEAKRVAALRKYHKKQTLYCK